MSSAAKMLVKVVVFGLVATVPSAVLIWLFIGPLPSAAPGNPVPPPASAADAATLPATPVPATAPASGTVDVSVGYAGEVAALPEAATVFVFLRATGQRMPLTVERFRAGELPRQVTLAIPDHPRVGLEVVARLSRNGDVRLDQQDAQTVLSLAGEGAASGAAPGAARRLVLEIPAAR